MREFFLSPSNLLIPIVILAIGLMPLPTPYYTAVRFAVFFFGLSAFYFLPTDYKNEKIVFLICAVIYNPIFPVYFGTRLIWWPINAFTLYMFWKLRKELLEYEEN